MKRNREFEDILNDCLEHILNGGDVQACLVKHPEYAKELEPLLRTALAARSAADLKPRPEFRQRAANEFQMAIREMPAKARHPFRWQLRWVLPVAIILVLVLGGGGTVMAAANSLPDSPLYQVKLATEDVQLALTRSDIGKAQLYAKFANRRVEEIVQMAQKGNLAQVQNVTKRMDNQLLAVANLTAGQVSVTASYGAAQGAAASMPTATNPPETSPPVILATPPSPTATVTPGPVPAPPALNAPSPSQPGGNERTNDHGKGASTKPDKHQKLKQDLQNILDNIHKLQDELKKAPDSLKPALEHAIEIAQQRYQDAINNLDGGD